MDLIAADFGIRQLHARFADAVWRQDADSVTACFVSDGQWSIAGMQFNGHAEIGEACNKLLGRCERIHLQTEQPILHADGEDVLGRLSMTEFAWMPDGTQFFTVGTYHDRYGVEATEWRFRERVWNLKYRGPIDLSAPLSEQGNLGRFAETTGAAVSRKG